MSLSDNLRAIRKRRGDTQKDAGEKLGISPNTYSNYERGDREPGSDFLTAFAKAYGVTVDFILGISDIEGRRDCKLTPKGQQIGLAYEKSPLPVQRTVEVALEPYMEEPEAKPTKEENDLEMIEMEIYEQPAAAGYGNYLSGDDYELISFIASEVPARADFGVRISGNSMEPTIEDGSIAWVQSMSEIDPGDIGIFILNGDAYCKELSVDIKKREIWLISHNEDYDDIEVGEDDDLRTVGKVLL